MDLFKAGENGMRPLIDTNADCPYALGARRQSIRCTVKQWTDDPTFTAYGASRD